MVKVLKIVLVTLVFQFYSPSVYPQTKELQFEHITEQEGLSHSCISCIIQDSKGFIWIGTEGGLNKYDGYTIKEYTHDPDDPFSLSHNFIRTFYEDPADSGKILWIGTKGGGLNKYDAETDRFISYQNNPNDPNSLSHNEVQCIYKDKAGTYWIGTEGGGLNKFVRETEKFVWYKNDPNNPHSMSANIAYSLCEDRMGYLWLANGGGGLDRFDPKTQQFTHYRYDPNDPEGLPVNNVFFVYVDRSGELWIGTRSGLRKYDARTDRVIRHEFKTGYSDILDRANIWKIFEDRMGGLWIGTHGNGLYYVNPLRDEFFSYQYASDNPNSISGDLISSIYQDQSGIIWVGTYCAGVTKMLPKQKDFKHYQNLRDDPTSLSHNSVASIYEDRTGNLWVGTAGGGLNKFDRENRTFTRYQSDAHKNVLSICGAKSGELWIAAIVNLTRFNPQTGRVVTYRGKFLGYHPKVLGLVNRMREQRLALEAIQHVGNNQDVAKAFEISRRTQVLIVAMGEGDANGLVDSGWLTKASANERLWEMQFEKTKYAGGTFRNRIQLSVMVLNPGKYHLHYRSNSEHSYSAWTHWPPNSAELWGASIFPISQKEAFEIDSLAEVEHFLSSIGTEGGEAIYVYEDRSEVIWCVLRGIGLFQFDRYKKEFSPYEIVTREPIFKEISLVYQDRTGTLWFGTLGKGLVKRIYSSQRESTRKNYEYVQYQRDPDNPHSIASNNINSIFEDEQGFLWIGTDNGLEKFDKQAEVFFHYRERDGLPSDLVYGVAEDNKGTLWICTNRGLSNFNPETQIFRNYSAADGLQTNVLTASAFYKSVNGEIFLGGFGLNFFHPDSMSDNQYIPPIVVTDFQLFNKSVPFGNNSLLKKSISETKEITLSHNQNVISFEFAALDFTNPVKNKYSYKMDGVDLDWVYTDASRRFATYTNLDPGDYIFRVKGSNNDGVWNEEGTSLRIIITPPFWSTAWFRLLMFLMIAGLIYSIYRYRVNRLLELERMRIQIASDLHDDIGSTLTKIAVNSEIIQTTGEKTKVRETSRKIGNMSREIITTLSDVVWSIDARNDSVGDLIDRMRDFLDTVFPPGSIQIDFQTKGLHFQQKINQTLRQNIYLIFKEAVNNAAKHSKANLIRIHLTNGEGKFRMEIADNGIGMDLNQDRSGHHGLENMKLRAARIGGDLKIETLNGTQVILMAQAI